LVQKSGERVEPLLPELAVAGEPLRGLHHGFCRKRAAHDPARLFAPDQPGALENAQVLHEAGERHREGLRQVAHRTAAAGKEFHHLAARRIRERPEHGIERTFLILNHMVQY
jgi:hypothetical protein